MNTLHETWGGRGWDSCRLANNLTRCITPSPEPSAPSPSSPSAGPSTPRPSDAGLAAKTQDGMSPPAWPHGSDATAPAARQATVSRPTDRSPPSTPARPPPPAAPHPSASTKTANRYSPPPVPEPGSRAVGTSQYSRCRPAPVSAPSPQSCCSTTALLCQQTAFLRHLHRLPAPHPQTSAAHSDRLRQTQSYAAPHKPTGTACNRQSPPGSPSTPLDEPQLPICSQATERAYRNSLVLEWKTPQNPVEKHPPSSLA